MKNPVLSPSGNYYEKSAIIDWIEKMIREALVEYCAPTLAGIKTGSICTKPGREYGRK